MDIKQISTNALMIYFENIISKEVSLKVQTAYYCIKNLNDKNIIELTPSYNTIFLTYNTSKYNYTKIKNKLLETINLNTKIQICNSIINIDVYYGIEVGYDLKRISNLKKISIQDIIFLHSQEIYDVYAIGFLPGFGFLGKVNDAISIPRLATPRKKVPKGSVAIANIQTAVYPQDSAGGWNIIGRTTKKLFDKNLKELSPLSIGKKVKFNPITKQEFLNQGGVIC
jgi:KipI family sensor histidine kinase inhibitor